MNYKLNYFAKQIDCRENLIDDFPALKFGSAPGDNIVFDATAFYKEEKLNEEDCTHTIMCKKLKVFIELLAQGNYIKTAEVFFQNKDGHLLISKTLAYPFIITSNMENMDYIFSLLDDIFGNGHTLSNAYITFLAANRLSNETLKSIIRENEKNTSLNK